MRGRVGSVGEVADNQNEKQKKHNQFQITLRFVGTAARPFLFTNLDTYAACTTVHY